MPDFQIIALPAFRDNYIWLMSQGTSAVLIDPGDAEICLAALAERNLDLDCIWITHHHDDHIDGLPTLAEYYACPIYGPQDERISHITHHVHEGSSIDWKDHKIRVLHLPGHTKTHIVFWSNEKKYLFCGDVLFSAGCGRVKEGEVADLYHSLQRIMQLPGDTQIFCAHEYTLDNLQFAINLESDNSNLHKRYQQVKQLREMEQASIPMLLDDELSTNPFLRSHLPSIRQRLDIIANQPEIKAKLRDFKINTLDEYYFAVMRLWKNIYV